MVVGNEVRNRMVAAGADLIAHRGYGITFADVIARADAPRGSIYYHFPDGKAELAIAVAAKVRAEVGEFVASVAQRFTEPVAFLERLVDLQCRRLVGSGYELGCPMMGLVITADMESPQLREAVRDAFVAWVDGIAGALRSYGVRVPQDRQIATVVVIGLEGAIVLGRANRSPEPFETFRASVPALVAAHRPHTETGERPWSSSSAPS